MYNNDSALGVRSYAAFILFFPSFACITFSLSATSFLAWGLGLAAALAARAPRLPFLAMHWRAFALWALFEDSPGPTGFRGTTHERQANLKQAKYNVIYHFPSKEKGYLTCI